MFLDQGHQVKNGAWHLEVARDGDCIFELRRWPRELDLPITGVVRGDKAIHATTARIKIGDVEQAQPIPPEAKAVTFSIPLKAGRTVMQTWLADTEAGESHGVYYGYVKRL